MMIVIIFWSIIFLLLALTFHEFSHGIVAYYCGDTTAKDMGRLSLNPLKHIDPLWTVALPFFLVILGLPAIGMARPVPVDFGRLHNPKRDMIWVGIAGPLANVGFAGILVTFYKIFDFYPFLLGIYINMLLALFNLIPIPPLDGSRVLTGLLPRYWAYRYIRLEPFGFLIVLMLFWSGFLGKLIVPLMDLYCRIVEIPTWREFLVLISSFMAASLSREKP